ncbi:MAG: tryptophan 2,3-dioxygenase [Thermoplasmatota archaeon]
MPKTYGEYLELDRLLDLQNPLSPEHDEVLFLIIHQTYELWFKEILHEVAELRHRLRRRETPLAIHTATRIRHILKTLVGQVDILETMTPVSFASFRARFETASGFQSVQFREIEAVFGRRGLAMMRYQAAATEGAVRIDAAMHQPTVWDAFLRFLAASGYTIPDRALGRAWDAPALEDSDVQKVLLAAYRSDPSIMEIAERLVDIDEGFMEWRYRHLKMVERTIGFKPGTGGSSGADYLKSTIQPFFPDLWAIRTAL